MSKSVDIVKQDQIPVVGDVWLYIPSVFHPVKDCVYIGKVFYPNVMYKYF